MTKIKKLEMASVVSNEKDITVTESFFGLCEKAIYTPTGSRIKADTYEYSQANGERLISLVDSGIEELQRQLERGVIVRATPVGHIRAEVCVSDDRQFLAVNILKFSNFEYVPVGDPRLFHGHDAEIASRLFRVGQ